MCGLYLHCCSRQISSAVSISGSDLDHYSRPKTCLPLFLKLNNIIVTPSVEIGGNSFTGCRLSGIDLIDRPKNLDSDQRRHDNHSSDPKRVPDDISAHSLAGCHAKGSRKVAVMEPDANLSESNAIFQAYRGLHLVTRHQADKTALLFTA